MARSISSWLSFASAKVSPINPYGVAEIFHSTGTEEGREDSTARAWPIGYTDHEVIFILPIPAPYREAHIVADNG